MRLAFSYRLGSVKPNPKVLCQTERLSFNTFPYPVNYYRSLARPVYGKSYHNKRDVHKKLVDA
jgi:hypothetical protein